MARATSSFQPQDHGQPGVGEWQELRGELVALLDQVETQVARTHEPSYQGLAERMRDLRHQVGENDTDSRHREALKSVQRAVEKFSDRDMAPPQPVNPRDRLEDAIQQIRTRHFPAAAAPTGRPVAAPHPAPQFDELAVAVDGISDRLERLEAELRTQARGQTANVHEIAEQVGQLSHVVELLAGAVGETGQVKRLESHIAGLAKLISDGPKVDVEALNQRLDDVALTVGTLAELQKQYADRSDVSGMTARFDDVSATVGRLADLQVQFADKIAAPNSSLKAAMTAIEAGVRSIYDRVDAIEQAMAMPPAELEKITAELGRIAQMVKSPSQPQGLIELIDALNQRISDIEVRGTEIGGLKLDMETFRATVLDAMEPRFTQLETRITALGDKLQQPSIEPSIAQLEAQVRQLVARMDQTGEQLTGLAKLYATPASAPDFEALADLVATRTSDAVKQQIPAPKAGIDEAGYAEIEKRVGKLIDAAAHQAPPVETVALKSTIVEVSERLQRLEASLAKPAAPQPAATLVEAPAPVAAPATPAMNAPASEPAARAAKVEPLPPAPNPISPLLEALSFEDESVSRPQRIVPDDAMPANPTADVPLVDTPFGDPDPVQAAFDAMRRSQTEAAKPQPKPSLEALEKQVKPVFDPSLAERPPQPKSTLDLPDDEVFVARRVEPVLEAPEDNPAPNRNTFIEAHRRAARQTAAKPAPAAADSSSLIGRAFARFQASRAELPSATPVAASTPAAAMAKAKAGKPVKVAPAKVSKANPAKGKAQSATAKKAPFAFLTGKATRQLAGDKEPPTTWSPDEAEPRPVPVAPEPSVAELRPTGKAKAGEPQGSHFIVRHRQPILLAASVVAIACLTLNLINQRMQSDSAEAQPMAQAVRDVGDAALAPVPMAQQGLELPSTPPADVRVVLDTLTTASIDGTQQSFVAGSEPARMPQAFEAATTLASAGDSLSSSVDPLAIEGPVKVDRPPAEVGPEALLAAAGNGDARAQFEVAAIYTEGRAVPEDLTAAAMWYERAASQGFVPAQYRLGNLYENGKGVGKDLEQARLWYQRAAEGGNRMAMHNLAALYAGGGLGTQQFDAAAKWFEEAAGRGMKDSQFNLGMLYARGLGVKQDLNASFKWFSLAANRGDQDAAKARDDIASSLDAAAVQALMADVAAFKPTPIDLVANFAPIGTWSAKFDPGAPITTPKVVMGVQTALNLLGFDVGIPDGVAGARTAEAIKSFEQATGMSESGEINPRLLAVLGSQPV